MPNPINVPSRLSLKALSNGCWAELPQRWPRVAPYVVLWKFSNRVHEYAHGYLEILMGLWSIVCIEVRSFTRSWDNRGIWKIWTVPGYASTLPFLQIFNGLLFGWTLWMNRPNLKSVANLPVPEIIGLAIGFGWGSGWPLSRPHEIPWLFQ